MPRKLPLHVERNHVKGHTYLSFRRGKGPRTRLPGDPTSEEFIVAYQVALLGQSAPVRDRFVRAAPGTIAALIASYMKSAEYIGLRNTSKTGYVSRLECSALNTVIALLPVSRANASLLEFFSHMPIAPVLHSIL